MARTNSRSQKMERIFGMRFHEEDFANLKLAAMERGMDISGFVRQLLIKEKVINPT